jgi:hypothetical protein
MAPWIWSASRLGCWAGDAVKKQKRLKNKRNFVRVAILLLDGAVYLHDAELPKFDKEQRGRAAVERTF